MKYKNCFFVIDTSSLLFDPTALTHYSGNTAVIPISVIQELDGHKDRDDLVGFNARLIIRKLNELKKLGDLSKGVLDELSNVIVRIASEDLDDVPDSLNKTLADDRILSVCFTLLKVKKNLNKVFLVTNDINLGLKSTPYGIPSFEFEPKEKYHSTDYQGHRAIEEDDGIIINHIYAKGKIPIPDSVKAYDNEFFLITNPITNQSIRCVARGGFFHKLNDNLVVNSIRGQNNEQFYALTLLMDPNVQLVTLTGLAGSGKTLLSCAAALEQVLGNSKEYEKIVMSRSLTVLSGKDKLGFLKGSLKEKLQPYLLPLKDAVDQLLGEDRFEYLTGEVQPLNGKPNKSKLEIEPLQFIRGRTLRNCIFIVDEAQNLTLSEIKTIVSRMGEGSKIILLGDLGQIDNPYINYHTNGLAQLIEKFKDSSISGHITLAEGVRSELATEAAKRL